MTRILRLSNRTLPTTGAAFGRHAPLRSLIVAASLTVTAALPALAADGHPGGPRGGPMGPAMMFSGSPERVARHVDRLLDGLNASDAQRAQIKQIAQTAAADLAGRRDAERTLRQRFLEVFTVPNVDALAAESVRQQMQAQHDQASRRVLQAMLDMSRVLTPEQRTALAERAREQQTRMQDRMKRETVRP